MIISWSGLITCCKRGTPIKIIFINYFIFKSFVKTIPNCSKYESFMALCVSFSNPPKINNLLLVYKVAEEKALGLGPLPIVGNFFQTKFS
jgi:hypothetical protein